MLWAGFHVLDGYIVPTIRAMPRLDPLDAVTRTLVPFTAMLLLVFFDHPHGDGVGRLQPTAMERTIRLIDAQLDAAGVDVTPPCDADGRAR